MGIIKISGDEFRRHKEAQAGKQEPVESAPHPDVLQFRDAGRGQATPMDVHDSMFLESLQDMLSQLGGGISILDVEQVNVDLTGKGDFIRGLINTEPTLMNHSEEVRIQRKMDEWEPAQVTQILKDASEADINAHPAYHTALWRQALMNKRKETAEAGLDALKDPSQGLLIRVKLEPEMLKDSGKGKPKRPRK